MHGTAECFRMGAKDCSDGKVKAIQERDEDACFDGLPEGVGG